MTSWSWATTEPKDATWTIWSYNYQRRQTVENSHVLELMHQNPDNTAFNLHVLHVRRPSNSFYIVMSLDNESIIPQQLQDQGTIKRVSASFFMWTKGKLLTRLQNIPKKKKKKIHLHCSRKLSTYKASFP